MKRILAQILMAACLATVGCLMLPGCSQFIGLWPLEWRASREHEEAWRRWEEAEARRKQKPIEGEQNGSPR